MNPKKSSWLSWLNSMRGELFVALVALLAFWKAGPILRGADSTAAPLDLGTLSMPALGVIAVLVGIVLFFLMVRVFAPFVDKWFDGDLGISFERDWLQAGPVARLAIFFTLFIAVLFAVAGVTIAAF